jgi:hypothetical protein
MWIDQRGSEILPAPECLRLLALAAKEGHIGRKAVNGPQSPLVIPLYFAFHDNGIRVRIGPGGLSEVVPGSLVSFEVDRVQHDDDQVWSVLVQGLASPLATCDAADLPNPLVPTPGAVTLFIRPDVITGRRSPLVARDGEYTS